MFFFQFLLQAGLFFTVPLFLSVALGLSAVETGVRLLPLSVTLLAGRRRHPQALAAGVAAAGRRTAGWRRCSPGIVSLVAALEVGAGPEIVTVPLLLAGLGVGALASQLGAVTVSAVPDEQSGEVGGLQNTATNLGASLGTALAGSVLIGALTASFLHGIQDNPDVPAGRVVRGRGGARRRRPVRLRRRPRTALDEAGVPPEQAQAIVDENEEARIDGLRLSLAVLALFAAVALYLSRLLPTRPVGSVAMPQDRVRRGRRAQGPMTKVPRPGGLGRRVWRVTGTAQPGRSVTDQEVRHVRPRAPFPQSRPASRVLRGSDVRPVRGPPGHPQRPRGRACA